MADTITLNAWIADRINESVPTEGSWTVAEVAEKLVARLEETEPERFDLWMRENAARFLHDTINARHRSYRGRVLRSAKRARFSEAVADYQAGDSLALDPYLIPYKIDEESGITGYLGDMTGTDCGRAAVPFERRIQENALQAKFLRALERKCGRKKVKNVYSREQLLDMFSSLGLEAA